MNKNFIRTYLFVIENEDYDDFYDITEYKSESKKGKYRIVIKDMYQYKYKSPIIKTFFVNSLKYDIKLLLKKEK